MEKIKAWAKILTRKIFILNFVYKDERVPWYTKVFTACVVAYAFSPIDLIPDCEVKAENKIKNEKPKNWLVASLIILIWSLTAPTIHDGEVWQSTLHH